MNKKFLLVLPVLVIPFLTLAFYGLGGGSGTPETAITSNQLNAALLSAQQELLSFDKFKAYQKAKEDSTARADEEQQDPFFRQQAAMDDSLEQLEQLSSDLERKYRQLPAAPYASTTDPSDKVMEQLAQLQQQIRQPAPATVMKDAYDAPQLLQTVETTKEDPQLVQLASLMDQVLDAQHPERVKERMKKSTSENPFHEIYSSLPDTVLPGFYSLAAAADVPTAGTAIEAMLPVSQELYDGAVIKLQTLQDMYTAGERIPAGHYLYSTVSIQEERMQVTIVSIRYGPRIIPVKLPVYDLDGLPGICIPVAAGRTVSKEQADQGIQSLEVMDANLNRRALTTQAAHTGVQFFKQLLQRKLKRIRVTLPAGYRVYLQTSNH